MHEHNRLSRALLARVVVCVIIALVSHVVHSRLLLGSVRAQDFPIVTSIFEFDLAIEYLNEMLSHLGRSSELSHAYITLHENLFHDRTITVDHIQILLGQATVLHHANPLLEDVTASHVRLDEGLVSHHEGAHVLEDGDLNREVERADNSNRSEGESVALRELSLMVSRIGESTGEEADLISTEVLKESTSNSDFSLSLL